MLAFFGFLVFLLVPLPFLTEAMRCGQRPSQSSRVVNGEDAIPNTWPWQVSLHYQHYGHVCGGSLIKKDLVMTAAHCVNFDPRASSFKVIVGAHYREGSPTSVQETINVVKVTYFCGYNPTTIENDVALLKLEKKIAQSDKVNTVCLPQDQRDQISPGTKCFITGWGRTIGGGNASEVLQQAELPIVDHKTCNATNHVLGEVHEKTMLCAGGQGKGGCQGDSGGPLVCKEKGRWVLRGAVSWGHYKCDTEFFSVFARVSKFVKWIKRQRMSIF